MRYRLACAATVGGGDAQRIVEIGITGARGHVWFEQRIGLARLAAGVQPQRLDNRRVGLRIGSGRHHYDQRYCRYHP